jgi:hypothetical protein
VADAAGSGSWSFSAPLLAIAGEFTGKFAPYQAVQVKPHPKGGVLVSATDQGKVAVVGYDPRGEASGPTCLIASDELIRACRAVKSATRELSIEGMAATVRSITKSTSKSVEMLVQHSSVEFPPLDQAIAQCVARWGQTPKLSETAGRYDSALLERTIKAAGCLASSIVLSAYDGGPLRIQAQGLELLILLMPQTAEPIPPVPEWILATSSLASCP